MARVTVEDCLDNVENRFELVMVASKRARQIATGGKDPMVQEESQEIEFRPGQVEDLPFAVDDSSGQGIELVVSEV